MNTLKAPKVYEATEVYEAYAFANTPSYLYRKLRASKYVLSLSDIGSEQLFAALSDGVIPEDAGTIALAYAHLVALLMRQFDSTKLRNLPSISCLPWAEVLIAIHASKPHAPVVNHIKFPKISQVNTINTAQAPSGSSVNATVARVASNV
jgi:hypothetical protein